MSKTVFAKPAHAKVLCRFLKKYTNYNADNDNDNNNKLSLRIFLVNGIELMFLAPSLTDRKVEPQQKTPRLAS